MPVWPLVAYAATQATAKKIRPWPPNSSTPRRMQAKGVLAAPARTATEPTIAKTAMFAPTNFCKLAYKKKAIILGEIAAKEIQKINVI